MLACSDMFRKLSTAIVQTGSYVPAAERGFHWGMLAAACPDLLSVGLPPRSGTAPMTKPFTEASNLPLSPLVALLAIGTMSPAACSKASIWVLLPYVPVLDTQAALYVSHPFQQSCSESCSGLHC